MSEPGEIKCPTPQSINGVPQEQSKLLSCEVYYKVIVTLLIVFCVALDIYLLINIIKTGSVIVNSNNPNSSALDDVSYIRELSEQNNRSINALLESFDLLDSKLQSLSRDVASNISVLYSNQNDVNLAITNIE